MKHFSKWIALAGALGFVAWITIAGVKAQTASEPQTVRIGYQRSSTLISILKANGELEKALAPLNVKVTWNEFTSGLPLLEALNLGNIDFSADVADTVPVFAQAAGAKLVYVAEEAASPSAQAILVPENSQIKSIADLKGRKVAVTRGAGSHYLLLVALASKGLSLKDITPAYLTPADGRAAFVSNNIDAWVAWDPFLTTAKRQSNAKILADGTGLASYKRYYLASERFAETRNDVLKIIFTKLDETGRWVKSNPQEAAALLAGVWGIDADSIAEANSHRSYRVGAVTAAGLSEQQKIADAFLAEGLIPQKIDTAQVKIWSPQPAAATVRGRIENVDGPTLTINSREGITVRVKLADKTKIVGLSRISLAEIQPHSFVGVAALPQADGTQKAVSVHVFPESLRGFNEGSRSYDVRPNSTMTNGAIAEKIVSKEGEVLTIKYKNEEKKVTVDPDTSLVRFEPDGTVEELKAGAVIVVNALRLPDGTLEASRVLVGRKGLAPAL